MTDEMENCWAKLGFEEVLNYFKHALPNRYNQRFFKDIDFLFRIEEPP